MKRTKKIIAVALAAFIVLIAGGVLGIDHLAKVGVEEGATYALGVETTLDSIHVGILSGSVDMAELIIANPPEFEMPHFLKLGRGRVAVSLGSLMSDRVVIPELIFSGVSVNLERRGGKSNYGVIFDGLKKFESAEEATPTETKDGKRFVINKITIDDVNVQVDLLPIGGALTRVPVIIERIELRNVGTDSDKGILLADLSGILIKAILDSVARKGGNLLPGDIAADLQQGLASLGGLGSATVQVIGNVTTVVGENVNQITEQASEMVGKLGESGKKVAKDLQAGISHLPPSMRPSYRVLA